MTYIFTLEEEKKIQNRFGLRFLAKVQSLLMPLASKWKMNDLQLVDSFSANVVFKGHSAIFGPSVMKFSNNAEEFISESNALDYLKGQNVCRVFAVDYENLVLLEECICPGDMLFLEKDLDKRLAVFCDLFRMIHVQKSQKATDSNALRHYKFYKDWVFRIQSFMVQQGDWEDVALHMSKAKERYIEVSQNYKSEYLLHGDFHYYNILKGEGGYKVIDPKGVIGHKVFDIPRYVLNEFWDLEDQSLLDERMDYIFEFLNQELSISKEVLSKVLYIEGAMGISWCVESGALISEKPDFLLKLEKLEGYVQKYREK